MSVRRLAAIQPESFTFTPVLWLVQKQEGWVSEPAVRAVAELLAMPVIRVLEVVTFYTMFQLEPVGSTALVQVCGTTPCMLRGANELMQICKEVIGPRDTLSKDGRFTWQEVECLGACVNAPMAQINDRYYEDLTPDSLARILQDFRAGAHPEPGSYAGRHSSEPRGGAKTLSDPALYDGSLARPFTLPNRPAPVAETVA